MTSNAPIRRKLVIVGDGACGKTSLLCVFAMGEFPKEYEPTIFENYVAEIHLDGRHIQLALWDTAGQEEYERLRPLSYSMSHVILIAFAIDTPDSLENVTTKWNDEVRSLCGPSVPVILVGLKADLRPPSAAPTLPPIASSSPPPSTSSHATSSLPTLASAKSYVSRSQGEAIAQEIGARTYKECSALNNSGVDEVFEAATRASLVYNAGAAAAKERRGSVGSRTNTKKKSGGCCVVC